jgi:hypothetical protein
MCYIVPVSIPYLIYGIGSKKTEIVTNNHKTHTTPPRIRDVVAETVTFPFRRSYFATWLFYDLYATPCMCIESCWIKGSYTVLIHGFCNEKRVVLIFNVSKMIWNWRARETPPIDEWLLSARHLSETTCQNHFSVFIDMCRKKLLFAALPSSFR